MSDILSNFKSSGRAAVLALALGAMGLASMPAMAQSVPPAPSFSFEFGIHGGGHGHSYGIDRRGDRFRRDCLTNNEIRRGLRRNGFEDIRFVDRRGVRVTVVAEYGRWDYRMSVDRCTGKVSDIRRVRSHFRDFDRRDSGFGLHFRF